jgi:transcriptional regulator GlxA family with amidase domain
VHARPRHAAGGAPSQVVAVLRSRRDRSSALVALADGRYAVTTEGIVALGGRRALARWCERRALRSGDDQAERAWWQEVIGALIARG